MSWKLLAVALASLAAGVGGAHAQGYPNQVVKVVANQPPGGASDLVARLFAQALSDALGGKSVIVDNRAGASGAIGLQAVAQAAPDGHTLLMSPSTIAINPAISGNTTYSLENDVTPIAQLAKGPYMLVATPSTSGADAGQLAAFGRASPGKLKWGLSNVGAGDHLAAALLSREAGMQPLFVPYKGAGPAMTAILANEVDVVMFPVSVVMPQVAAGKLRSVGITSPTRLASLPDVKTIAEAGFPGYEFETWFGLWGPKGMSAELVKTIRDATGKAFADARFQEGLAKAALLPGNLDTDWFRSFVSAELGKYKRIADEHKIRAE